MNAREFFERNKTKRTMENEYFIAMEKELFFRMMDDYADQKIEEIRLPEKELPIMPYERNRY